MELRQLYDQLWEVGGKLQGNECLDVLEDNYEPFGRLRPDDGSVARWRQKHSGRLPARKRVLREFRTKEDCAEYTIILKEVFAEFGASIRVSLERTMGKYLESTGGELASSKLEQWQKDALKKAVCHNNHAERTFAVMKAMAKGYPFMKLSTLTAVTMARMNGDFTSANKSRTVDPRLREAVARLCRVRQRSPGAIATMCRLDRYTDQRDYKVHHEKERDNKIRASNELAASRAKTLDIQMKANLAQPLEGFNMQLEAFNGAVGETVRYLKEQFHGRI